MKNAFIFLTTKLKTYERFKKIVENSKNKNIDFYFCLDISKIKTEDINKEDYPEILFYNGNEIWERYNHMWEVDVEQHREKYEGNPQFILIEFWSQNKNYDYYWFCEDDIFLGDESEYGNFFEEMSKIKSDLLLTDIKSSFLEYWYWYNFIPKEKLYKYPLHYFIQLFRLSQKGCEAIFKHFDASDFAHSECAIPSIIYMEGLSTKFINTNSNFSFDIDWQYKEFDYPLDKYTFYHPLKIY